MLGFNLDLRDQLTFYGSYHHVFWNQLIHFVFVPAILWSVAVWLAYTPLLLTCCDLASALPAALAAFTQYLRLNGSAVLLGGYSLYYLLLEPVAGLSWATLVALPLWAGANFFRAAVPQAWAWAVGVHVLGWFMQVGVGWTGCGSGWLAARGAWEVGGVSM